MCEGVHRRPWLLVDWLGPGSEHRRCSEEVVAPGKQTAAHGGSAGEEEEEEEAEEPALEGLGGGRDFAWGTGEPREG